MVDSDDKKRKLILEEEDERGESGESGGSTGQGGAIEFHEFIFVRTDKYTAEEERQILTAHREANGALIEKQKKLREQRHDRKENPLAGNQPGAGLDARNEGVLRHPILSEKAEFDGVDPQVNLNPSIYEGETNSEKKEELAYQHQLRLGLENQPRFTPPKPSPF